MEHLNGKLKNLKIWYFKCDIIGFRKLSRITKCSSIQGVAFENVVTSGETESKKNISEKITFIRVFKLHDAVSPGIILANNT